MALEDLVLLFVDDAVEISAGRAGFTDIVVEVSLEANSYVALISTV